MSPREFAADVVRQLVAAGYEALFAGGCVRDLVLGREPKDYDVATNALPEAVRDIFGRRRTLAVGASFGVIVVLGPTNATGQVEVATFRSEGPYLDGRRPEQVTFTTAEADAQRRDFTINGMFFDPLKNEVIDYVGGQADLQRKVLRAIGNPRERMTEDKLRMLRAVRFAAGLDFLLDAETAAAVKELAPQLTVVSAERVAQELKRMLTDSHRRRAVELCQSLDLLPVIFPELGLLASTRQWTVILEMLERLHKPSFELATAVLLQCLTVETELPEVCQRLRLSNDERHQLEWLVAHQDSLNDAARLPLCRLKRILAHEFSQPLMKFMAARIVANGTDSGGFKFCADYLRKTPVEMVNPAPLITGADLKQLGLSPGPRFKQLLDTVRDAQLNEQISTPAEAMNLVQDLQSTPPDGTNKPRIAE